MRPMCVMRIMISGEEALLLRLLDSVVLISSVASLFFVVEMELLGEMNSLVVEDVV